MIEVFNIVDNESGLDLVDDGKGDGSSFSALEKLMNAFLFLSEFDPLIV